MRLFLAILEGPNPAAAKPVMATEDPRVIEAAIQELLKCLGGRRVSSRILDLASRMKPVSPEPGR